MLKMFSHYPFVLTACLLLVSGCEKQDHSQSSSATEPPPIEIAICDIDKIAKELGFIDDLTRILTREGTLLENKIRKLQAEKQAALDEKLESYGEFPDDEQKRELTMMQAQARQVLLQADRRRGQIFTAMRNNLIKQIRTKIKKPVDQVATKKGINIVITDREESVLYTSSIANITPEVLSAARNADLGKLELQMESGTDSSPGDKSDTQSLNSEDNLPGNQPSENPNTPLFDE